MGSLAPDQKEQQYSRFLEKTFPEIFDDCRVDPRIKICNDNLFWDRKYLRDFGHAANKEIRDSLKNAAISWREQYQANTTLWTIGSMAASLRRIVPKDYPQVIRNSGKMVQISAGTQHFLVLTNQGLVKGLGDNSKGQLGISDLQDVLDLTEIPRLENIVEVSAGHQHSLALDAEGRVWGWGDNEYGQLGLRGVENQLTPVLINSFLERVIQVKAGYDFSLVVTETGQVWASGRNNYGQLGLGWTTPSQRDFVQVPFLYRIVRVASGQYHSLALHENGTVFSFGRNNHGQLGLGHRQDRASAEEIPNLSDVDKITCGYNHSLIINGHQQVWGWGDNQYYQLSSGRDNPTINQSYREKEEKDILLPRQITIVEHIGTMYQGYDITEISAGAEHSLFLSREGKLFGCGSNHERQLGLPLVNTPSTGSLISQPTFIMYNLSQISSSGNYSLVLGHNARIRISYEELSALFENQQVDRHRPIPILRSNDVELLAYNLSDQPFIARVEYDKRTQEIFPPTNN